ncbi:hypothetical protein CSW64_09715 [Caulobacter mirabilis]|uniref:Uncharacterized protein n=1 Tax=Caulobacter mirabilis TaxID=69666 RepID=A0A2D2AXK7_9CAUL|nr:hypothetical protein CSW64_09715 [Caulobacter mirabilis]
MAEPELAFAPLPRTAAPRASRTPLIAGGLAAGLAVVVAGGVGVFMLNNRSAPTETARPAAGLAIETQAPVAATSPATGAPLAVLPETPQVSASATPPATAQPASAPVRQTRAEAPVLRPSARVERTAPAEVAPPPVLAVETPPLIVPPPAPVPVTPVGPPPAAAERPPADPSAPMTTRLPDGTD